ncbi:hypothetical protein HMN09_00546300 [Mycena chlorophos]|uniref:Uncharacterized protein n=1 Tax=Mycena chlorophos TaxID=658473 RepID=A0A8H6TDN7_MYCCL|nr:hypothetical protein HMN09_00546300 [Mycena chlorophos]
MLHPYSFVSPTVIPESTVQRTGHWDYVTVKGKQLVVGLALEENFGTVATSAPGTLAMGQGPPYLVDALSAIVQHIPSLIPIAAIDATTNDFNLAQAAANAPLNNALLVVVDADSGEALCTS